MKKKALAIIPARGGSKRIPKKNIRHFCSQPILKYSIDSALNSGCFSQVMVSTDSDEIAKVAKSLGAKVPFLRSNKTADDYATMADVALEVIAEFEKLGETFDHFCCLLPTAPFITADRIKESYELLTKSQAKAVVPVVRFSHPIHRALKINSNGLKMLWPENYSKRSQDFEPTFHDSGQFYWLEVESFLNHKSFFPEGALPLELLEHEVHDIDTEDDWKIAELKYQILNHKN
jgi:N-acylneuraminate cytidylyltransferase